MHVVLINPEIPQNTGSIARTCAATKTELHLVGKLGFEISDKTVRRAGLDYWSLVKLYQHPSWEDYKPKGKIWLLSKYGKSTYLQADFSPDDSIVFGGETKGLGADFLSTFPEEQIIRIPMPEPGVRSLNLSNAVSIVLYRALEKELI